MGRRKKEPRSVHRENIAAAAAGLFMEKVDLIKDVNAGTKKLDDIAKAAGYSKAQGLNENI